MKEVKDDILMIYRFRNLIVHNAHYDSTLLPYFVWKIKIYAGNLIRELIKETTETNSELKEQFIEIHLKKQIFFNDLKFGIPNLFKQ